MMCENRLVLARFISVFLEQKKVFFCLVWFGLVFPIRMSALRSYSWGQFGSVGEIFFPIQLLVLFGTLWFGLSCVGSVFSKFHFHSLVWFGSVFVGLFFFQSSCTQVEGRKTRAMILCTRMMSFLFFLDLTRAVDTHMHMAHCLSKAESYRFLHLEVIVVCVCVCVAILFFMGGSFTAFGVIYDMICRCAFPRVYESEGRVSIISPPFPVAVRPERRGLHRTKV